MITQIDSKSPIVVGIDGSESSMRALRWGLHQAVLDSTTIDAVTAWQYPIVYGWALPPSDDYDHRHIAQKLLADVIGEVAGSDRTVEIHDRVVEGHPIRVLLDAARDARLLVLGHGGDAEVSRALGSVSRHCTHSCPCTVVVVR